MLFKLNGVNFEELEDQKYLQPKRSKLDLTHSLTILHLIELQSLFTLSTHCFRKQRSVNAAGLENVWRNFVTNTPLIMMATSEDLC